MCTLSMRYHFGFSGAPVGDRPLCILVHMGWAQRQVVGVHWAVQGLQSGFPIWIYKSLTGRPAIVTVTACLLLIRDAFRTPMGVHPRGCRCPRRGPAPRPVQGMRSPVRCPRGSRPRSRRRPRVGRPISGGAVTKVGRRHQVSAPVNGVHAAASTAEGVSDVRRYPACRLQQRSPEARGRQGFARHWAASP